MSLQKLDAGDLLVFYARLTKWGEPQQSNLYIVGYFEVVAAGAARDFTRRELWQMFRQNADFRWRHLGKAPALTFVKGGNGSRLLEKAVRISADDTDAAGRRLLVMSPEMQGVFGDFGGKRAIQRCPPRWVDEKCTAIAAEYIRGLK